jgi:three-Cys-motif partner protein
VSRASEVSRRLTSVSPPKSTLWPIDPHTRGKHQVLRRYLDAWLAIMGRHNGRILFIDGFSGPGQYEGGEDGSPLIALKALRDHPARSTFRATIVFLFVDNDRRRTEHLSTCIEPLATELGEGAEIEIMTGAFDATVGGIAQGHSAKGEQLAPAFVMIDPFGVSDTPMSVIAEIFKHPQSEVYVSVMWDFIERFHKTKEFPPHLDALFGTREWRTPLALGDESKRKRGVFSLYKRQLKASGAEHVVHFELYEGEKLVYAIFHGSKHRVACDRMKQAIWKVAQFDGIAFRPGEEGMVSLFADDRSQLKAQLLEEFGDGEWRPIDELEEWIQSDATIYHSTHLRSALKELEEQKHVEAKPAAGKKRRGMSYPGRSSVKLTR